MNDKFLGGFVPLAGFARGLPRGRVPPDALKTTKWWEKTVNGLLLFQIDRLGTAAPPLRARIIQAGPSGQIVGHFFSPGKAGVFIKVEAQRKKTARNEKEQAMLKEIHFLLTYACNYECDHCFLYCGPRSAGTFTLQKVKNLPARPEARGHSAEG